MPGQRRPAVAYFFAACIAGLAFVDDAAAVQVCELNGASVNLNNGASTAGKTGLVRCREGEGGPVVREQEVRNGVFMGAMRYFRDGALERDYSVNERGNRDGLAREYEPGAGGKSVLVREATYRDGSSVGLSRSWYPTGTLRRVAFHGDAERELAMAEFTTRGQLRELRCGPRPLLGSDPDDAAWCGFAGSQPSAVTLYNDKGTATGRVAFARGERVKRESLWESGAVRDVQTSSAAGGSEMRFAADGVKRYEKQWQSVPSGDTSAAPQRITTLEQEFHESGKLVQERRWRVAERGGELVGTKSWYLNGQPRETNEYVADGGKTQRRETRFFDNGRKSSEGAWIVAARSETATGVHRSWDEAGNLRSERFHDERGRVSRERELDERGAVVRDDELFEDGSRKATGRR